MMGGIEFIDTVKIDKMISDSNDFIYISMELFCEICVRHYYHKMVKGDMNKVMNYTSLSESTHVEAKNVILLFNILRLGDITMDKNTALFQLRPTINFRLFMMLYGTSITAIYEGKTPDMTFRQILTEWLKIAPELQNSDVEKE